MAKHASTLEKERKIIEMLKHNPMSLYALEEKTGWRYYTCRNIVNSLMERGIVTLHSVVDRNNIYAYNVDNVTQHEYIPRLTHLLSKSTTKAIYLIEGVGNEDGMKSTEASKNLPKHMVELMRLASMASQGADITFMLNSCRDSMQKDFLYVKNLLSLYEQILKEPRFWNVKFLSEMPDDPDYNYMEVQKAVEYYESLED